MSRVDELIDKRRDLAFGALGYFTGLRNKRNVPDHVRAEAQRVEDEWQRLTAAIDAEFAIGRAQRAAV